MMLVYVFDLLGEVVEFDGGDVRVASVAFGSGFAFGVSLSVEVEVLFAD